MVIEEIVVVDGESGRGEKCGGMFNSVPPVRAGTTVLDSTVEVLVVTLEQEQELHLQCNCGRLRASRHFL